MTLLEETRRVQTARGQTTGKKGVSIMTMIPPAKKKTAK
jgi:hypothetical protein